MKLKKIIGTVIILVLFIKLIHIGFLRIKPNITNEELINNILLTNNKKIDIFNNVIKFSNNFDLNYPKSILEANLYYEDNYSLPTMYLKENKKYNFKEESSDEPIIYIYNTHQTENYKKSSSSDYKITPTVVEASLILKEVLNTKKINTIVEEGSITDLLNANGWDYSYSYDASRYYIKEAIKKYPNLKLIIDIHRDAVKHDSSTVVINNKKYAKVMFVLGLKNKNYEKNLNVINDINNLLNKNYPTLSRGILKKEGKYVNGLYNQDLSNNVILIELGGNENTLDEITNTTLALSDVLEKYIKGE